MRSIRAWTRRGTPPSSRARSSAAFAVAAGIVSVLLTGCDAGNPPPPTTPPARTSPSPTRLTAVQKRCVAEGRLLTDVAQSLQRIPSSQSAAPSRGAREAALAATQTELGRLTAGGAHRPFVSDEAALIRAANDMISGYQGLLDHGDHKDDRVNTALVIRGSSAAAGVEANVAVHRAQCLG